MDVETSGRVLHFNLNLAFIIDWGGYYRNYSWTLNLVHIYILTFRLLGEATAKTFKLHFHTHFSRLHCSEHFYLKNAYHFSAYIMFRVILTG